MDVLNVMHVACCISIFYRPLRIKGDRPRPDMGQIIGKLFSKSKSPKQTKVAKKTKKRASTRKTSAIVSGQPKPRNSPRPSKKRDTAKSPKKKITRPRQKGGSWFEGVDNVPVSISTCGGVPLTYAAYPMPFTLPEGSTHSDGGRDITSLISGQESTIGGYNHPNIFPGSSPGNFFL